MRIHFQPAWVTVSFWNAGVWWCLRLFFCPQGEAMGPSCVANKPPSRVAWGSLRLPGGPATSLQEGWVCAWALLSSLGGTAGPGELRAELRGLCLTLLQCPTCRCLCDQGAAAASENGAILMQICVLRVCAQPCCEHPGSALVFPALFKPFALLDLDISRVFEQTGVQRAGICSPHSQCPEVLSGSTLTSLTLVLDESSTQGGSDTTFLLCAACTQMQIWSLQNNPPVALSAPLVPALITEGCNQSCCRLRSWGQHSPLPLASISEPCRKWSFINWAPCSSLQTGHK